MLSTSTFWTLQVLGLKIAETVKSVWPAVAVNDSVASAGASFSAVNVSTTFDGVVSKLIAVPLIVICFPVTSEKLGLAWVPRITASPVTTVTFSVFENPILTPSIINVSLGKNVGSTVVPTASISWYSVAVSSNVTVVPAMFATVPLGNTGLVTVPISSMLAETSVSPVKLTLHFHKLPLYLTKSSFL